MQCPRCQTQNRPGAQFCRSCGARLEAACPRCQARVEPGSRFCDACGAELGEVAALQRRWNDAEQALREALTIAQAIGNPGQLWRTHAAMGRFRAAAGKADDARAASSAARDVLRGVIAGLATPELKSTLQRAAFVQRINELAMPR